MPVIALEKSRRQEKAPLLARLLSFVEPYGYGGGCRLNPKETQMRTLAVISMAATALTASLFVSQTANAERVCKERCEAGVCEQKCVEMRDGDRGRGDRVDRDRGHDRHQGVDVHVPGLNVNIGR